MNFFIAPLTRFISLSFASFYLFSLPLRQVIRMPRFLFGIFYNVEHPFSKQYLVILTKSPDCK